MADGSEDGNAVDAFYNVAEPSVGCIKQCYEAKTLKEQSNCV